MRQKFAVLVMSCACCAYSVSAVAKDKEPPASTRLNALAACQSVAPDAARLACYDREARALTSAAQAGELRVVDRADIRTARRSLFGFTVPHIGLFGGGDEDIANEMTSTIKSVEEVGRGRWRMVIADDGAIWETIDSPMRLDPPRPGNKIVIKRASMGSFFLRIDGQLGVKGRRVG